MITPVLARFEDWLATRPDEVRRSLRPGATPAQIQRSEKALGLRLPPSLRALYEWRNGEGTGEGAECTSLRAKRTETSHSLRSVSVFADSCNELFEEESPEVRLMSLTELRHAGPFHCNVEGCEGQLLPFLWIRARSEQGADWFLAVDSKRGAVWLLEIAAAPSEGPAEVAPSLAAWLDDLVSGLEQDAFVVRKRRHSNAIRT